MAASTESSPAPAEAYHHRDPHHLATIFAQEYYTFLNKQPSSLHMFYNEEATLTHGHQGRADVTISQGLKAIQSKIKELDLEDCKIMISDIDSQASFGQGIVIQVLGEMSNRGGVAKKFAQTFVLMEQRGSYYVFNDIFRYLKDDTEDTDVDDNEGAAAELNGEIQDETPAAVEELPQQSVVITIEENADTLQTPPHAQEPILSEGAVPVTEGDDTLAHGSSDKVPEEISTDDTASVIAAASATEPENSTEGWGSAPWTPTFTSSSVAETSEWISTPASTTAVAQEATPAPAEPPKPRTWANTAASNVKQWGPQVAVTKTAAVVPTQPATTTSTPTAVAPKPQPQQTQGAKPQGQQQRQKSDLSASIYIKDVTDKISVLQLREAFAAFGTVKHCEIQPKKPCATLDFTTTEAAQAALKAQRVKVGPNETVRVEERFWHKGGNNNNGPQGGRSSNPNHHHHHHHHNSTANGHGQQQQQQHHHQQQQLQQQQQQQQHGGNRAGRANTPRRTGPNKVEKTVQSTASK